MATQADLVQEWVSQLYANQGDASALSVVKGHMLRYLDNQQQRIGELEAEVRNHEEASALAEIILAKRQARQQPPAGPGGPAGAG